VSSALDTAIPLDARPALERYVELLLRWNSRINLTAARAADDAMQHVADCAHLLEHIPLEARRLVDVGSGGGLPAVVIAVARPELEVTAVEPTGKKHAFLRTVARELGLGNLQPLAGRANDVDRDAFDVATSRATFALDEWLRLGLELVRPGGLVLGMEGRPTDLPAGAVRHPYAIDGKSRAIIGLQRST
jgi:16S rRNA (guanine527-N7)-methyltransferase